MMAAALAAATPAACLAESQQNGATALQEVVVTAERHASTVQSTPMSITAVSGSQLQAQGISNVEELAATTPAISMRTSGPGQTEFEMRGLSSSGGDAPTVGFYLDDTPLSPAAASLNGKVVVDPDLFDLGRIEVLRGPQGTLYGSGSMGGTIRLITNPPKLGQFEGAGEFDGSGTAGGGFNRGGNGMLNLPLGPKVALRIVATDKYIDGWISRIVASPFPLPTGSCPGWAGQGCVRGDVTAAPVLQEFRNTNWSRLQSGRFSLLAEPSDDLSFTTLGMYQRITAGGYNQYQDPPGSNQLAIYQPYDIPEPSADTFRLISEAIRYQMSFAELTSDTSYFKRDEVQTQDATESLENLFAIGSYLPIAYTEEDITDQLTQEFRLTSVNSGPWEWVGGIFFSDLLSTWIDTNQSPAYAALTPPSVGGPASNPQGIVYNSHNPYRLKQYAAYGQATYHFSPLFALTAGLRYFKYQTQLDAWEEGLGAPNATALPTSAVEKSAASGVTPKATVSYMPAGNFTLYGTIAKGFRPGGASLPVPTSGLTICPNVSETYGPDSVWDYEVGEKARMLGDRLMVNGDVYYIKWNNMQNIVTLPCGYPITTNLGDARSYGPELEVTARITSSLSLELSGTWISATITNPQQGSGYSSGDRVLNIPKETGSASLIYAANLSSNYQWMTRATDSYTGNFEDASYYRQLLPGYNMIEVRTGLIAPKWALYLYGTNLTNKIAALTINNTALAWTTPSINRVTTNQPRTIGLDLQFWF